MDEYDRGLINAYINSVGGSGGSPCIAPGSLSESTQMREAKSHHFQWNEREDWHRWLNAYYEDTENMLESFYWRELVDRQDIGPLLREDWINPMWGY